MPQELIVNMIDIPFFDKVDIDNILGQSVIHSNDSPYMTYCGDTT